MVFSAEPLAIGEIFAIKIENILACWCGSIEIGILQDDPVAASRFPSASSIESKSWIISGEFVYKNSQRCEEMSGGRSLDELQKDDILGIKGKKSNFQPFFLIKFLFLKFKILRNSIKFNIIFSYPLW